MGQGRGPSLTPKESQSTGLALGKREFLIPSVVSDLIKEGAESVDVLTSSEKWFGVTFPEDKKNVSANIIKLTVWATVSTISEERICDATYTSLSNAPHPL